MTDVGLAAVARGCPNLRHLNASGCLRLTDASVRVLATRAGGGLRVLDITGCRRVRGEGGQYVEQGGVLFLLFACFYKAIPPLTIHPPLPSKRRGAARFLCSK